MNQMNSYETPPAAVAANPSSSSSSSSGRRRRASLKVGTFLTLVFLICFILFNCLSYHLHILFILLQKMVMHILFSSSLTRFFDL